jgi:hypothetical protein
MPQILPEGEETGDLLEWTRFFDDLDAAMHDFEVGLSRQDVEPLRNVPPPHGQPPLVLHTRWAQAYQRISELEFRARSMREDLRSEFARISGGRRSAQTRPDSGYGSSLDVSG